MTLNLKDVSDASPVLAVAHRLELVAGGIAHMGVGVVVLAVETYNELVAQRPDFKAWLTGGPKLDDFAIERPRDTGRDVSL